MAGASLPSPVASPGRVGARGKALAALPPLAAGVAFLAGWEILVRALALPSFVLPSPSEILAAGAREPAALFHDALTTFGEAMGGYVAGTILGLLLAVIFVGVPFLERIMMPLYVTINSVPMIAYGPLAIIWLGVGSASKVLLIAIAVSYTILINTLAGLRSCDPSAVALLRSFGAGKATIMRKLRVPAALPQICSGLRIAVVHSMILAVVLEMLGARAGLGWSVFKSTQMMGFVEAWVAVAATVAISLAVYSVVTWATRRLVWW